MLKIPLIKQPIENDPSIAIEIRLLANPIALTFSTSYSQQRTAVRHWNIVKDFQRYQYNGTRTYSIVENP